MRRRQQDKVNDTQLESRVKNATVMMSMVVDCSSSCTTTVMASTYGLHAGVRRFVACRTAYLMASSGLLKPPGLQNRVRKLSLCIACRAYLFIYCLKTRGCFKLAAPTSSFDSTCLFFVEPKTPKPIMAAIAASLSSTSSSSTATAGCDCFEGASPFLRLDDEASLSAGRLSRSLSPFLWSLEP